MSAAPETAPEAVSVASGSRRRPWIQVAVGLVIVAAVAWAIYREWPDVVAALRSISVVQFALSLLAALVGVLAGVKVWQHVLAGMGSPEPFRYAGPIYLIGALGKYIPGSLWAFALQAELARRANVPRWRAVMALAVTAGVSSVTALVLAPAGLAFVRPGWLRVLLVAAPLAVVTLHPAVLQRLLDLAARAARRRSRVTAPTLPEMGRASLWALVMWVSFGVHLWLLTLVATGPRPDLLLNCVVGFALAMTAGVLAVVAPSGIGVREAVIVAAMSSWVARGSALGYAVASRFIITVAEVVLAAAAVLVARRLVDARAQAVGEETGSA